MERSNPKQPPLHIASKKKYDNDDKYTKKNRDQRGTGDAPIQRYARSQSPSATTDAHPVQSSSSSSSSSGGALELTAEETAKIAASLGITEYSGHYSTDGTPMRRIDEDARRSSPVETAIRPAAVSDDSWGDDDFDLSDDEV